MARAKNEAIITDREIEDQIRKAGYAASAEERVSVRLPRDPMNETGVCFVGVNGFGYTIPRGVTVSVPRSVYLALENAGEI